MALDGLVIHSIVDELHNKLLGGKIDKVYQPENDEVVLHIRNNKENFKLILSCSSSNPRVYIASDYKKENPINAPIPDAFAAFFLSFFHTRNKINPTNGIKKPKTPHPNLLPSFFTVGVVTTF